MKRIICVYCMNVIISNRAQHLKDKHGVVPADRKDVSKHYRALLQGENVTINLLSEFTLNTNYANNAKNIV